MGEVRIKLDDRLASVRASFSLARPLVTASVIFALAACSGGVDDSPVVQNAGQTTQEQSITPLGKSVAEVGGEEDEVLRASDASPDFELELFSNDNYKAGERLKLSELVGTPVLVNFWFPSCPPCRLEMPDFQKTYEDHGNKVQFIGVQTIGFDSIDDGQNFVKELGISYAIGPDADGSILKSYKVSHFPTTFFLDSQHREVRKWSGPLNKAKLEELIQELLQYHVNP